ncbi:hypothetical protein DN068_12130 [Taibaiella soli]|uniref:Uncharacterized protein n=2 Tax=Taibaiella soli TaxID=1649169 RepID=A0A2W2B9L7_9BACT|nr:hypothetical protein DN068_12130 [Taibaiella soli]
MHISTEVFDKSLLIEDLKMLVYDELRLLDAAKKKIDSIRSTSFQIGMEIEEISFEVNNRVSKKENYYVNKSRAVAYCKRRGLTLIKDGRNFYIDDLDRYVAMKKKSMEIYYGGIISKLIKGIFYAGRNSSNGRLDHNLTAMSKCLVEIIREDNGLVEIDLKNSQFAIHAYWLKQEGLCDLEDVGVYYDLCSNGKLYEELGKMLQLKREDAKQLMMELAFSSEKNHTAAKKKFKERFPNVVAHIDGVKKEGESRDFSITLQKREAEIFVDNLYPSIKDAGLFCLTKHDSLIVKRTEVNQVLEIVREYFNYLEFECTLDVDGEIVKIS